jgi:O-antigen ligase
VGIANFPRAEGTISTISRRRAEQGLSVQFVAAHNTYVQVGAETGVTGLAIWIALLYSGTIGLLRLRRRIPVSWDTSSPERRFLRESCLFLPFGFLAFAVSSTFLSHGYTVILYMLVAYVAAIRILVKQEMKKDQEGAVIQTSQAGPRMRMRPGVMRTHSGVVGRRLTGT